MPRAGNALLTPLGGSGLDNRGRWRIGRVSDSKFTGLLKRHRLQGVNKPKRTPDHPTKSHMVLASEGEKAKLIRFGQQGVKTNQTAGQREAFKSPCKEHQKGKMSAAYWANKVKWSPSKTKSSSKKWKRAASVLWW